jgi:hypothetical protein
MQDYNKYEQMLKGVLPLLKPYIFVLNQYHGYWLLLDALIDVILVMIKM